MLLRAEGRENCVKEQKFREGRLCFRHGVLGYHLTSSTSAEKREYKLRTAVITSRKMWRRREVRGDNTFLTLCKIPGEKRADAIRERVRTYENKNLRDVVLLIVFNIISFDIGLYGYFLR